MARAARISTEVLKRYRAGESLRSLAREVGISHVALRKRIASPAIQRRLLALEAVPEEPAATPVAEPAPEPARPRTPTATGKLLRLGNSEYEAWLSAPREVIPPLLRHPETGTLFDPTDDADVARVEALAAVMLAANGGR